MVTKVAMIADLPESADQIDGGVQAVTSYLVDALQRMPDVDLHILSFRLGIRDAEIRTRSNLTHYTLPFSQFGTITGFAKDQVTLDNCLRDINPDLVHSQGAGHHGIIATRCNFPTVITIHGIGTQEANFLTGIRRRFRTRLQGWMSHYFCIRRASHTILISPYVAEHFGKALKGRQYQIPNPIHERFFEVVRNEEPGRVLFAGRLYALKGVKELLQAASRVTATAQPTIVLAGSTADHRYVNELRAEAARLNMTENVVFRGVLSTSELLQELSICTCLVLPSYQETAPMVIQEAMASGLPVIASDICGIPYQVDDGKTGFLFPPGDTKALTDRLNTLLADASLRRQFSAGAKVRAESEYRALAVAQRTVEVYRTVLG